MVKTENECVNAFKSKVCEFCPSKYPCLKKGLKAFVECPKYTTFKLYGTGEIPVNYFGTKH